MTTEGASALAGRAFKQLGGRALGKIGGRLGGCKNRLAGPCLAAVVARRRPARPGRRLLDRLRLGTPVRLDADVAIATAQADAAVTAARRTASVHLAGRHLYMVPGSGAPGARSCPTVTKV
ncbi:hypothetical protein GCM10010195_58450 [Kitasatospora griseola]|nr:hypothetical protein GCM10010195_58450 [Kitasatospora griseola]